MTDIVLVLTTVATAEEGERLARDLVEGRLAACVNVLAPMTSFYRWNGLVERDAECQLVIKTTRDRIAAVEARVRAMHPYALPELIVIGVEAGADAYLDWVRGSTRSTS